MQVPEKLTLIGGSILLASTLIFTLKSQASNILPKVNSGMSSLVNDSKSGQSSNDSSQKQQQAQAGQTFNNNFQQAQQKGWQTGSWGTAKFYVDGQNNMYVGKGALQGSFYQATGTSTASTIRHINFTDSVKAPENSSFLFSGNGIGQSNSTLTNISGTDKIDTTDVYTFSNLASNDTALQSIDLSTWYTPNLKDVSFAFLSDPSLNSANLSGWDTSQVTNGASLFSGDANLKNAGVSDWDTSSMQDMSYMFNNDSSIENLDLTNWKTSNARSMSFIFNNDTSLKRLTITNFDTLGMNKNVNGMFANDNIYQLNLGNDTKLSSDTDSNGTYQSNGQTSSLVDGNAHPGTWIRQ